MPGDIVNYSDIGMALLGQAFALQTHKSFEQSVDEKILKVLGMNNTRDNSYK